MLSANAHADWDAAGEAREAAERKSSQERHAREKVKIEKQKRDALLKAIRADMSKAAVGKSDAEVEHIYKTRQADALKQSAAVEAAAGAGKRGTKQSGVAGEMGQVDSTLKNPLRSVDERHRKHLPCGARSVLYRYVEEVPEVTQFNLALAAS